MKAWIWKIALILGQPKNLSAADLKKRGELEILHRGEIFSYDLPLNEERVKTMHNITISEILNSKKKAGRGQSRKKKKKEKDFVKIF